MPALNIRDAIARPEPASLQQLAEQLYSEDIVVVCDRPRSAPPLSFIADLRGALGVHLLRSASSGLLRAASRGRVRGTACEWTTPSSYDALYGVQGHIQPNREIPKPFVLQVDAEDDLVIRLRLFGIATHWTTAVADGLILTIRDGGHRSGLQVRDRQIMASGGLASADAASIATLRFLTPVRIDTGDKGSGPAALQGDRTPSHASGTRGEGIQPAPPPLTRMSVFRSLARRIEGMARWCCAKLDPLEDGPLEAAWSSLVFDTSGLHAEGIHPAEDAGTTQPELRTPRRGRIHPGQPRYLLKDLSGWVGTLRLEGDLAPVMPMLALAQHLHVGRHTTDAGFGRCVVATRR